MIDYFNEMHGALRCFPTLRADTFLRDLSRFNEEAPRTLDADILKQQLSIFFFLFYLPLSSITVIVLQTDVAIFLHIVDTCTNLSIEMNKDLRI